MRDVVQIIASVTLVLVLFVDASTISVPDLIRERRLPMRLLLIGLPLTMLFGSIAGFLIFQDMASLGGPSHGPHPVPD